MESKRILIVEDSELASYHLKVVLNKAGYTVAAILKSGEEAIDWVKGENPDLIIMDIMLDGELDGVETSIKINEISRIPIIYHTALYDKNIIERVKPTFPYSFLNKTFSELELLSNVELSLNRHQKEKITRESEEQLSSVIELMKNGLMLFDSNLKLVFINKSGLQLLQVKQEDLLGLELFKDIRLQDYHTGECLKKEAFSSQKHKGLPPTYLNDEFISITYQQKSIVVTDLSLKALNMIMISGAKYMLMFNEASKELQKQEISKEKEREKIKFLIEGQEMERARISRELHDGLGQLLNVARMKMKRSKCAEEIIAHISEAIQETSRISENLSPSALRSFSLKSCVEDLCSHYNELGIKVGFQTNIENKDLEKEKLNLFRIIQEAVNNSSKHARAQNIDIQLYKLEDAPGYTLSIEDDGEGFDTAGAKHKNGRRKSHGLINIADRVKILNGQFDIESSQELGTFISIKFQPV